MGRRAWEGRPARRCGSGPRRWWRRSGDAAPGGGGEQRGGLGVVPATAAGRRFRDELGRLNAAFGGECEHLLLVVAGQALVLKQ